MGKTAALRRAFTSITGEIVVIQDADLEYDPEEIPLLIEPIVKGAADVVFGSRFRVRKAGRVIYFYHYLANVILTFISNLLTNLNMTDIESCYKAFKSPILQNMTITSKRFGIEIEMTAKIAKLKGVRVYEVPISYYGRSYEEGKKIYFSDGIWAFWYVVKYNWFCSIDENLDNIEGAYQGDQNGDGIIDDFTPHILDECGVCNGDGIVVGTCDCYGNVEDCVGVCGGSAILDKCGVCNGDVTTCEEISGCTYPEAINYNSDATKDDGSCE